MSTLQNDFYMSDEFITTPVHCKTSPIKSHIYVADFHYLHNSATLPCETKNVIAVILLSLQSRKFVKEVLRCSTQAANTLKLISVVDAMKANRHVATRGPESWIRLVILRQTLSANLA